MDELKDVIELLKDFKPLITDVKGFVSPIRERLNKEKVIQSQIKEVMILFKAFEDTFEKLNKQMEENCVVEVLSSSNRMRTD